MNPDGVATGSVWCYRFTSGEWQSPQQLFAEDGGANPQYGATVAISVDGTSLAVGAPNAPGEKENETGRVYLYQMR